jgi:hypothetical protein
VKGDGPGNLDFPETTAAISGNDLPITDVECSNPFVNEVDFFDPMSIAWSFSADDSSTRCDAGTSVNQTYITLGDPLTTVFHTLVHLGCKNADGENMEANCMSKIWSEFTDRDVRRIDGVQLTYYATSTCTNITTASLLANGDGQCGAWSHFMKDCLCVQGITNATIKTVAPKDHWAYNNDDEELAILAHDGFFINNWQFQYPWDCVDDQNGNWIDDDFEDVLSTNITYTGVGDGWLYPYISELGSDFIDQSGIAGQGTQDPALSQFNFHKLIKYHNNYYDPSYGNSYDSLLELQQQSIAGFWSGDPLNPDGGALINTNEIQVEEN